MVGNSNEKVTIITPLYNSESYITDTIDSVINQTYKNWEMIIVDDLSTDNSLNIVKEYVKKDSRIKLLESKYNFGGPAKPRNVGLDNAKGDYVAFLDADDVWLPSKLESQLTFLANNKGCDIIHTLANKMDENSKLIGKFKNQRTRGFLRLFVNSKNQLFYTNFININSVMIRGVPKLRFIEQRNYIAIEDWRFWIDMKLSGNNICILKERLLNYRVHNNSISNRNSDIGYRKGICMLADLLLNNEIPLMHYFLSSTLHFLKILRKKI